MGWEKNEKNGFCCERVSEGSQKPCPPQKKKVPSDSIPSLARHGHAPYQALHQRAPGASLLHSPDAGFSSPRINASQRTAACLRLSLTGPVARIGLSLACNNDASRRPRSRVKSPGLILRSLAPRLPRPFGPSLHPRYRFAPVAAASLRLARCVSASGRLGLLPQPPLPFRDFAPVRIDALAASAAFRPTFRIRPISSRSPQPVLFQDSSCGSPFQVRYVSGGLLFLKPLGTFPNMRGFAFFVNCKFPCFGNISSVFISRVSIRLRVEYAGFAVDKTSLAASVFAILVRRAKARHTPRRHRGFHRLAARSGVSGRPSRGRFDRSLDRIRSPPAGAFCPSRARYRGHRPGPAGGGRSARAPARRAGRLRFHRLLVWLQSTRIPRPGGFARTAVHLLLRPAGRHGRHSCSGFLPRSGALPDGSPLGRHSAHPLPSGRCRHPGTGGLRGHPSVFRQSREKLAARTLPRPGVRPGTPPGGALVRGSARSAAPRRRSHRGPLPPGLLDLRRPRLHRQRQRHHPPGRRHGNTRPGAVRSQRSRRVGSPRRARARRHLEIAVTVSASVAASPWPPIQKPERELPGHR